MRFAHDRPRPPARHRAPLASLALAAVTLFSAPGVAAQADSGVSGLTDPRVGLRAGYEDAEVAARSLRLVAHRPRPEGFFNPANPVDPGFQNTDLAFRGHRLFLGSYHGFQIWDIAQPANPSLRTAFVCPGGQGDPSIYGHLLFISAQETRSRRDCGTEGVADSVSAERFRGVRIFDIRDVDRPVQVAAVQTCRGSHTHTLVTDPADSSIVYVYVSGINPVRPGNELAGCSGAMPEEDPNTALFRIDIIRVPLAAPQDARIVNSPRIFADTTGAIAGLWRGGAHGEGTQTTDTTDQCHDITVFADLGLAAGACSGNGILLDIRDPANPKRIAEVSDPNFAYWHSATFNNDGTTVLFTDEWGGGTEARCRATDRPEWGADALFTHRAGTLRLAGYYKLPVPQTATEVCVAHNGSLIPVPGRDIMAQAWYEGGISVFDFTDPAHPVEIAFFDRGPMSATELHGGGYWSIYWYNGYLYGSEIHRGLDVLALEPSAHLSANEIEAAKLVRFDELNVQRQPTLVWPAHFVVARAYLDQLLRADGLRRGWVDAVARDLNRAERLRGRAQRTALTELAARLEGDAPSAADATRVRALAAVVRQLAAAAR